MQCYKCGETDVAQLSLKKQQRGRMTFICRKCRRDAARIYKATHAPVKRSYTDIKAGKWNEWARQSRSQILQNHK